MKLIHCADIHLDSRMETHMTSEQASMRNTEIIRSFVRMTEFAKENDVRVIIIAGDLFDGDRIKSRTVDEVLGAIRKTPDIDYLYLPGNHDEAFFALSNRDDIPNNLKQFNQRWETYEYENVAISGIEICKENSDSLYNNIPDTNLEFKIVVLHGQTAAVSGDNLVNLNLLKNRNIDYLALGHLHSFSASPLDSKGTFCYSGCLEGRGFDECGKKGFVLLNTDSELLTYNFVPFSYRELHKIRVDITDLTNSHAIVQKLISSAGNIKRTDMVEFILSGYSDPTANIAVPYVESYLKGSYFFCKVKNESHMKIDPNDYKNDISLKGEFIRLVLNSNENEEDKASIIRAGIQALSGEEITI